MMNGWHDLYLPKRKLVQPASVHREIMWLIWLNLLKSFPQITAQIFLLTDRSVVSGCSLVHVFYNIDPVSHCFINTQVNPNPWGSNSYFATSTWLMSTAKCAKLIYDFSHIRLKNATCRWQIYASCPTRIRT